MRLLTIAFVIIGALTARASAEEDLAAEVQKSLRAAKNPKEVASVLAYCRDKIFAMNFKEHDRFMVLGLKSMQENKVEEANVYLKQARQLDELSDNLSALVCRKR